MLRLVSKASVFSSEPALVAGLKIGDDAAFRWLVETRGPRLLRVLESMLADRAEAEDVLTETFSTVFRKIAQFDGRAQLSTWIHRIGVNAALLRLRGRRTRNEVQLDTGDGDGASSIESIAITDEDASAGAADSDVAARVREAIAALPVRHRTILMLRDIEQREPEEIATLLGISRNALKIRVHRARQALKVALEKRFGDRLGEALGIETEPATPDYDALSA